LDVLPIRVCARGILNGKAYIEADPDFPILFCVRRRLTEREGETYGIRPRGLVGSS